MRAVFASSLFFFAACSADPLLAVDVRSDLGASDVTTARARVIDGAGLVVVERSVPVGTGGGLLSGLRTIEQSLPAAGYSVRVELLDADRVVIGRTYAITLRAPFVLEAVLTRRCLDVVCSPPATECERGTCVSPDCGPEHPERCPPPECATTADCGNLCPVACEAGSCLIASGAVMCAAGERCGPSGCTTEPLPDSSTSSMDGGTSTTECTVDADCGATERGNWSGCDYPSQCAEQTTEERSVTTHTCNAMGRCRSSTSPETRDCNRNTDGDSCGGTTTGDWSGCMVGGQCATTGTQTRDVTAQVCRNGNCESETTTGSQDCAHDPSGEDCDDGDACTYPDTCLAGGSCRGIRECRPVACGGPGCSPVCTGNCLDYCECF